MPKAILERGETDVVVEATAPMPPLELLDVDAEDDGASMEEILEAAGAKRTKRGRWYRVVPDPTKGKERITQDNKVYYRTAMTYRWVAAAEDWPTAMAKAKADKTGMTDCYVPGLGWFRRGVKMESERPENVGNVRALTAQTVYVLEEVEPDQAAAEQALLLKQTMDTVSHGATSRGADAPSEEN
jgi:hypothetical protein